MADNRTDCRQHVAGKPLETRSPRTKRLTSQCCCMRSGGGNGRARDMPPSAALTVLTMTSNSCYKLSYCMDSNSRHKPAFRDSNVLFISVYRGPRYNAVQEAALNYRIITRVQCIYVFVDSKLQHTYRVGQ